ncbi:DUF1848 family protein [Priestia endophytica]|uniref:DUF1848 family protein n=1 Tax=Priestia endophytica TaxID=135735 RepID=UPI003BF5CC06
MQEDELTPEKVDCIEFCSKNYEPILTDLPKITGRFRTYFHYTITSYGKDKDTLAKGLGGISNSHLPCTVRRMFRL